MLPDGLGKVNREAGTAPAPEVPMSATLAIVARRPPLVVQRLGGCGLQTVPILVCAPLASLSRVRSSSIHTAGSFGYPSISHRGYALYLIGCTLPVSPARAVDSTVASFVA